MKKDKVIKLDIYESELLRMLLIADIKKETKKLNNTYGNKEINEVLNRDKYRNNKNYNEKLLKKLCDNNKISVIQHILNWLKK